MGKTGLQLSVLSYGSWVTFSKQVDDSASARLMALAYDNGINFFDNAEAYEGGRSEEMMGRVLSRMNWDRTTYCVSSKVFFGLYGKNNRPNQRGLSRKHITEACHAALTRLQVDYLDLFYCHRADPNVPIAETVRAMHDLVTQGKVLYWGTSEWPAEAIKEAQRLCAERNFHAPIVEQPQYNLFHRSRVEKEYAPLYRSPAGLGLTIWSPLASGLLTGKYNSGLPADSRLSTPDLAWLRDRLLAQPGADKKLAAISALAAVAKELGTTLPRLGVAWCLKNPNVSSVILGASRVEQLKENLGALDLLPDLTPDILARLEKISSPVAA